MFPDGVNVEFVVTARRPGDQHVRMRVHERGVGETLVVRHRRVRRDGRRRGARRGAAGDGVHRRRPGRHVVVSPAAPTGTSSSAVPRCSSRTQRSAGPHDATIDVDDGPAFAAACRAADRRPRRRFHDLAARPRRSRRTTGCAGARATSLGRGSVLGDVDADVVTCAFGFWPADVIREAWDAARAVRLRDARARTPRPAAPGAARFAPSTAPAASPSCSDGRRRRRCRGSPALAGWRAVPLPRRPGRLVQQLHVLREHRGGMHLVAVVASGLRRCRRCCRARAAPERRCLGWEEPFEDVSGHLGGPVRGRGAHRPPRRAAGTSSVTTSASSCSPPQSAADAVRGRRRLTMAEIGVPP